MMSVTRVLFICLGNICRSPSVHAVAQRRIDERGLSDQIVLDSAGTGSWHVGELPHAQARAEGERRGYVVDHVVRQVVPNDFDEFDLVVAMDQGNRKDLRSVARLSSEPGAAVDRIVLFRTWDPMAGPYVGLDDPYGKPDEDFAKMYDIIERTIDPMIDSLIASR
jgi:protein-tyrosine phosphatase